LICAVFESSITFPGTPYRIFLLFLPWLPCHFHFVVIKHQQVKPLWETTSQVSPHKGHLTRVTSQGSPHKGHLTYKLNSKTVPVIPSLIFPFHILPYPVHPTGFFFCFFPGLLTIFILLSSNNNNN